MNRQTGAVARRSIATALTLALLIGLAGHGHLQAMVAPAAGQQLTVSVEKDMATVQTALENKLIQQRLRDMGMSEQEAQKRLARLSPDQVHQVAMQIDQQTAAGDATGVIIVAIAVVLFVALIAYFLKDADDDDDDDDKADNGQTNVNQTTPGAAPAPAQQPGTIIVK
jgi:hypothetical protein